VANTKVRIASRALAHWIFLGVLEHGGIWDQMGLDADVQLMTGSREAEDSLLKGEIDYIFGSHIGPYKHWAKGIPYVYLAQTVNSTSDAVVASFPIQLLRELEGKRIAHDPLLDENGSVGHPRGNVVIYLERGGVDLEKVTFVENWKTDHVQEVLKGKAEATFVSIGAAKKAQALGLHVLQLKELPMVNGVTLTTLWPAVEKDTDRVLRTLEVLIRGTHFYKTEKEKTIEIIKRHVASRLGLDDAQDIENAYTRTAKRLEAKPYPRLQSIANAYRIAEIIYPEAREINPLALWNLHFVRQLEADGLFRELYGS